MLSRKVVTRRGRRFRGYFPSAKLGRMVPWESLLERDAILLLEFSPGVISYEAQPVVVHYSDGVQIREYYPDFEVVLGCGSVVHLEIKPTDRLANPEVASKFRAVASHYAARHREFRVLTEEDIRREPRLVNLRNLAYLVGRPGHVLPSSADLLRHFIEPQPFLAVEALLGRDTTLRLIAAGDLACNLDEEMSGNNLISIPKGDSYAALLF